MKIEFLTEKYFTQVLKLWKETFDDDENFIENFFACWPPEKHTLILREEDKVLGMLSLLPVSANGVGGRYIYAVATEKKARRKGVATQLLAAADKIVAEHSERFSLLVPSSKSLFDFYRNRGWGEVLYAPDFSNVQTENGQKISPEEYFFYRRKFFEKRDLIEWDTAALSYMKKYGEFVKIDKDSAFLWYNKIAESLAKDIFRAKKKPFALIKYYNNFKLDNPYFGISMN